MARPKKIDTITFQQYGVSVDIYLNKETGEFHGEHNGERKTSKQLDNLRNELSRMIENMYSIEWHPFISVDFVKPDHHHSQDVAFVGIDVDRLYLGKRGHEVAQQSWDDEPDLRYTGQRYYKWGSSHFTPSATSKCSGSFGSHTVNLPYTPELWQRLEEIQQGIRQIKDALKELVDSGSEHILAAPIFAALIVPAVKAELPSSITEPVITLEMLD